MFCRVRPTHAALFKMVFPHSVLIGAVRILKKTLPVSTTGPSVFFHGTQHCVNCPHNSNSNIQLMPLNSTSYLIHSTAAEWTDVRVK